MRKYILILLSYSMISCSSQKVEEKSEYNDSLNAINKYDIELLDLMASNIYSTIQTFYHDSLIFFFERGKDWRDTNYQMSVVRYDTSYVKININLTYPYDAGKFNYSDSSSLAIYKGYGYLMYWDKWNKIINSSNVNTIINNYKHGESLPLPFNYIIFYNKKLAYPNANDEQSLLPYERLENNVVRKIMKEIHIMEKNPRWK